MTEQRNLIIAIALSLAILLGFQFFFEKIAPPPAPAQKQANVVPNASVATPAIPAPKPQSRGDVLASSPRLAIETPSLHGSIALKGARIDDLTLVEFRETSNPNSPEITLLSPQGAPGAYFVENGWVPADKAVTVPDNDSLWKVQSGAKLTPQTPVILTWENGQGLVFTRKIAVDRDYMFSITQTVENKGTQTVQLHPYALISRVGKPHTENTYILHEGPLAVLDGTLREYSYDGLAEEKQINHSSKGGWLGITDKYWLSAVIPDQSIPMSGTFRHVKMPDGDRYQADYLGDALSIEPGQSVSYEGHIFAGAKKVALLEGYAKNLGIQRFDLAIDFGWFYFLTKPFFYLLQMFHNALGNFGLAILALTVLVKLVFFPLANKSYVAMSKMKALHPEIKTLQERFGSDKVRLQQELMGLYKREKVNPVSGCLPILVQIPVFFALYKVLFVTLEMRHAPFYGWITDLSAPDPTNLFNLFGLLPWELASPLHIGVWPLIMGLTMWLQQKLNPQPTDPIQAKMFMVLPIVFTFLLANFPAGLVIYWAWSNLLSIAQQWFIMRRVGVRL